MNMHTARGFCGARTWLILAIAVGLCGVFASYVLTVPNRQTDQVCRSRLGEIGVAIQKYRQRHNALPPSIEALVKEGLLLTKSCQCPFNDFSPRLRVDYEYVTGLGPADPADSIIAFDRRENHPSRGRHVLLASGIVRSMTEDELERAISSVGRRAGAAVSPRE